MVRVEASAKACQKTFSNACTQLECLRGKLSGSIIWFVPRAMWWLCELYMLYSPESCQESYEALRRVGVEWGRLGGEALNIFRKTWQHFERMPRTFPGKPSPHLCHTRPWNVRWPRQIGWNPTLQHHVFILFQAIASDEDPVNALTFSLELLRFKTTLKPVPRWADINFISPRLRHDRVDWNDSCAAWDLQSSVARRQGCDNIPSACGLWREFRSPKHVIEVAGHGCTQEPSSISEEQGTALTTQLESNRAMSWRLIVMVSHVRDHPSIFSSEVFGPHWNIWQEQPAHSAIPSPHLGSCFPVFAHFFSATQTYKAQGSPRFCSVWLHVERTVTRLLGPLGFDAYQPHNKSSI